LSARLLPQKRLLQLKKGKKPKKINSIKTSTAAFSENSIDLSIASTSLRQKTNANTAVRTHDLNLKVLNRFPELETKRLVLRRFAVTDATAYYELRSNEAAMRYMDRPPFNTKAEATAAIKGIHQDFRDKKGVWWALADKRNNNFIGYIGFKVINHKDKSAEIGYVLHPDHWASGWMTEAVEAVLDFVFEELNVHRVKGDINPDNEASRGLLLKFGFQKEAYFREDYYFDGKFLDSEIYGLLASEYTGN